MLSWGTITYGGLLSALFSAGGVVAFGGERRWRVAVLAALSAGLAVAGWNVVVRVTNSVGFIAEADPWPVSWKAGGSAVVAMAAVMVVLGTGPARKAKAAQVTLLSLLTAVAAFLVDVYLY